MTQIAAATMDIIKVCTTEQPVKSISAFAQPAVASTSEDSSSANPDPEKTSCTAAKSVTDHRHFSAREEDATSQVFSVLIKSNQQVLTKEVKSQMKSDIALQVLLHNEVMVKKVVNRIRHLQYKDKSTTPEDLPNTKSEKATLQWLDSAVSVASTSSNRVEWSEDENKLILKHFGNLEKNPKKKEILQAFNSIEELKPIMEKKGQQSCIDKVKNTLKKQCLAGKSQKL